jgi:hypothetical protein
VLLGFFLVTLVVGRLVRRRLSRGAGWGGPIFAVSKLLT